jgi:hypothetical protein
MSTMEEASRNNKHLRPVKSHGQGGGKIWEINLDPKFDITVNPQDTPSES